MKSPSTLAFLAVALFSMLVWLYVREFDVLSNTIEAKRLIVGSMIVGALVSGGILWQYRSRFTPFDRHFPGVILILVFSILFSPLFGSLLNRAFGASSTQSFEFVAETAYFASGYGILKGEKLKPTGWRLSVREGLHERRFKYKSQPYYPLTKAGEPVLLPICKGIFGIRILELQ